MPLPRLRPVDGPINTYLKRLPQKESAAVYAQIQSLMRTADGRILLEVLENATTLVNMPPLGDPRALDALNAQSFIASDLRRIADETEYLEPRPARTSEGGAGGTGRR